MPGKGSDLPDPDYGRLVFDSFALLAFLEDEESAAFVGELLDSSAKGHQATFVSIINLGEVLYIIERERGLAQAQEALARIDELPIRIVDVDRPLALAAAHIKALNSLAYADCFGAALAQSVEAALVTGDSEFKKAAISKELPIIWLT
jgi:ribonuclease VapC